MGETHNLYKGYRNNWSNQHRNTPRESRRSSQNRMQEEVKESTERAYYSQIASDQVNQKNNIQVMPSFGLQQNVENDIAPYEQNLNFQRFEQIKDFRGQF